MNRNHFLLFLWALQFAAIVLKMANVLTWSWWWTLALIEWTAFWLLMSTLLSMLLRLLETKEQRAARELREALNDYSNAIKRR